MLQSGSLHQHFDTFTSFWSKSIILEWKLGVFPNLPVLYFFILISLLFDFIYLLLYFFNSAI